MDLTKIAVFGGAFDPITRAHSFFAKVIAKCPDLVDEVWLLPANKHRFGKEMAPAKYRLAMCRLVFPEDYPKIKICDYEIQRNLDGTMYHTLLWMNKSFPNCHFHVAIGSDNANEIHKWAFWRELTDDFPFLIVPRGGVPLNPDVRWYKLKECPHKVLKLEKATSICSTDARAAIASGNMTQIEEMLRPEVWEYIRRHKLYGADRCPSSPTPEPVSV